MLTWLASCFRGKRPGEAKESELFTGLPGADEIRRLVERERARADRTGGPLTVVAFRAERLEGLAQLVGFLRARLRSTDEVGWLGDRVCAVLPDTDVAGARQVAREALAAVVPSGGSLAGTIFVYPEGPGGADEAHPLSWLERTAETETHVGRSDKETVRTDEASRPREAPAQSVEPVQEGS